MRPVLWKQARVLHPLQFRFPFLLDLQEFFLSALTHPSWDERQKHGARTRTRVAHRDHLPLSGPSFLLLSVSCDEQKNSE